MALTYHKAIADTGGAIGIEISSGDVANLLPKILLSEQLSGVLISRKFYIANDALVDVVGSFSLEAFSAFTTILFASTGDAQVVGDLLGSEVDESPIAITIPASSHLSFWLQVDVPALSTVTANYNTVDTKITY